MSRKITWSHLPVSLPEGVLSPHMSAKLRTQQMDALWEAGGGFDRTLAVITKSDEAWWEFTKLWAKGAAKPQQVEHSVDGSVEELIKRLDAGQHAKVIDG